MPRLRPSITPNSSVKTLLNGLFDYAGLFPPAALPLPAALEEYRAHQAEADDWMLGPFVIPVGKIPALLDLLEATEDASPIALDVLPSPMASADDATTSLSRDLSQLSKWVDASQGRVYVDSFELKMPEDGLESATRAMDFMKAITQGFADHGFGSVPRYVEIIRNDRFASVLSLFFAALRAHAEHGLTRAKIRCGGMSESDFPTVVELAGFIHTAIRAAHPFKATAGLHHPIRHFNEGQGVTMHGFMNVFFATTLGRVHALPANEIASILDETSASEFEFTETGIRWRDLKAGLTDFISDRRHLALSIGSCSFDEPREDMHALGWLVDDK